MKKTTTKDLELEIKHLKEQNALIHRQLNTIKPELLREICDKNDTRMKEANRAVEQFKGGSLSLGDCAKHMQKMLPEFLDELERKTISENQLDYGKKVLTRCIELCLHCAKDQEANMLSQMGKASAFDIVAAETGRAYDVEAQASNAKLSDKKKSLKEEKPMKKKARK